MDKQNMVYPHNGTLFSLKKEGNSVICYNMENLMDFTLSNGSRSQKDKYFMILFI